MFIACVYRFFAIIHTVFQDLTYNIDIKGKFIKCKLTNHFDKSA